MNPASALSVPVGAPHNPKLPDSKSGAGPARGVAALEHIEPIVLIEQELQVHFPNVLAELIADYALPHSHHLGASAANAAREVLAARRNFPADPDPKMTALLDSYQAGLDQVERGICVLRRPTSRLAAREFLAKGLAELEVSAANARALPHLTVWLDVIRHAARKSLPDVTPRLPWARVVLKLIDAADEAYRRYGRELSGYDLLLNSLQAAARESEALPSDAAERAISKAAETMLPKVRNFNSNTRVFYPTAGFGPALAHAFDVLFPGWQQSGCREVGLICYRWVAKFQDDESRTTRAIEQAFAGVARRLVRSDDLPKKIADAVQVAELRQALTGLQQFMKNASMLDEGATALFDVLSQAMDGVAADDAAELIKLLRSISKETDSLAPQPSADPPRPVPRRRESKQD